jgi:ubiquinone/menaquinone biosynthesis C-methylase UbiE
MEPNSQLLTARPADEIFEDCAFASLYDEFNAWGAGDHFYLDLARESGGPVLDLGCGTGMLACRIAAEVSPVVGADPAAGMLRVARSRPGAEMVEWIESDAQSLGLPQRFNLIYMTGHAFQVFLTDEDVLAALTAAARHLNPNCRLAFETRNPASQAWLSWTPKGQRRVVKTSKQGRVEAFCDTAYDPCTGVAELTHHYRFLDKGTEQVGRSRLRFVTQSHLADLIAVAGLVPQAWFGDWNRSPWSSAAKEIIAIAGLR